MPLRKHGKWVKYKKSREIDLVYFYGLKKIPLARLESAYFHQTRKFLFGEKSENLLGFQKLYSNIHNIRIELSA
jgi:hypothetical protein